MSLFRKSGLNLIGLTLPLMVGFATFPFVIDHYGLERFGVLTIMWVLVSYFGIIDLGLSRVVVREVGDACGGGREDRVRWVTATAHALTVAISTCLAATLAVLLLLFPEAIGQVADGIPRSELVNAAFAILVLLPFTAGSAVLRGELEGRQAFVHSNSIRVATGVAIFVVPIVIAPWTTSIACIAAGFVLVRIAVWFGSLAVLRKVRGASVQLIPDSFIGVGALLKLGGWMTVSTLITPLTAYVDRLVILTVLSASAVAVYATANEVATKLGLIPGAVTTVLFPEFARRLASGEAVAILLERAQASLLKAMLPIVAVLSLCSHQMFNLWLGDAIAAEASRPFQILCICMMISCMSQVPFTVCQSAGRARDVACVQVVLFVFLVPTVIFAVTRWGIEGAAWAWLARIAVDHLCMIYFARRALATRVSDETYWKLLGASMVGASALSVVSFTSTSVSVVVVLVIVAICGTSLFRDHMHRLRMVLR